MMKSNGSMFLLDVQEPFELLAFGAIAGVINISINEIAGRLDDLPADKAHPIAGGL